MKSNLIYYYCVILLSSFLLSGISLGQDKFTLTTGFGIYEVANIGMRYQIEQTQIGLSVGSIPWSDFQNFSVLGGTYFHFGNLTEFSNLKPCYFMTGLTYMYGYSSYDNTHYIKDELENYLYLTIRIGKEFNISKNVGIYADLGLNFLLTSSIKVNYYEESEPTELTCCQGGGGQEDYTLIPAIGLGIIFRL